MAMSQTPSLGTEWSLGMQNNFEIGMSLTAMWHEEVPPIRAKRAVRGTSPTALKSAPTMPGTQRDTGQFIQHS